MYILIMILLQSVGHLLYSVSMTIYIVLSVLYLEERDLLQDLGSQYQVYRKTTPAFIPSLWRSRPAKDQPIQCYIMYLSLIICSIGVFYIFNDATIIYSIIVLPSAATIQIMSCVTGVYVNIYVCHDMKSYLTKDENNTKF